MLPKHFRPTVSRMSARLQRFSFLSFAAMLAAPSRVLPLPPVQAPATQSDRMESGSRTGANFSADAGASSRKKRPWVMSALAGAAAMSFLQDRNINSAVQGDRRGTLGKLFGNFGRDHGLVAQLGEGAGVAAVSAGFYLSGMLAGSERARRTGVLAAEAAVLTGVPTMALKAAAGRTRPHDRGAFFFKPFGHSSSPSFPSGHTSTAFALGSVVADNYDSLWVDILAYGAAASVGFARVYQEKHWTSDVIAGAVIGTAMGKGLSKLERAKNWNRRLYASGNGLYIQQKF
ncbi:MAG: hypothetical protein A3G41_06605 [Elusimicrobia bacterium RIFCSPLOWO2_12_FULL_59_9]|nr:MAG: hypothetical protein A3G41_06605 [Elusimicrobia bacterium RIFCSPLOWO2_12_FULL_59_9]